MKPKKANELSFNNHLWRGSDNRIYLDSVAELGLAEDMFYRYINESKGKLPHYFLVPGRGAYSWFYSLYPHIVRYAKANNKRPPKFVPFISRSYQGQGEQHMVEIFGLERYVGSIITDDTELVVVEDIVDTGNTFAALLEYLSSKGVQPSVKLLAPIAKYPKYFEKHPELEKLVIFPYYIDSNKNNGNHAWIVFPTEISDPPASEIIQLIKNKRCGIYQALLGEQRGWGLSNINGSFMPNELLRAGFVLARVYIESYGIPDNVYTIWPDHNFDELRIVNSVPGVVCCDVFRAWSKISAVLSGSDKNVSNNNVGFYLITKGPEKEFKLQGKRSKPSETAFVVANELPDMLNRKKLEDMIGTSKLTTAAIFYTVGNNKPDIYLHAKF